MLSGPIGEVAEPPGGPRWATTTMNGAKSPTYATPNEVTAQVMNPSRGSALVNPAIPSSRTALANATTASPGGSVARSISASAPPTSACLGPPQS